MTTISHKKIKVLTFAFGLAACSAFAEEATVKEICWKYSVSGGTACIEGFGSDQTPEMQRAIIGAKKFVFPDKIGKYRVTSIGEQVMTVAEGPVSIKVPDSVTSIGKFAFGGNLNLESVSLPSKLTSIPEALFQNCENLKSVKIPASVKSIGIEAFAECRGIKTIMIPEGVKDIDRLAFRDCSNLTSASISASVTNVGAAAFIRCGKLAKISAAKDSRTYCNRVEKGVAGALFTKDGKTLVAWPAGSPIAKVTFPDGVTGIGCFAFAECPKITSITIPASVTNIEAEAFVKCPKLSVICTDAGNADRLKAAIAERNRAESMANVRIEEKAAPKK